MKRFVVATWNVNSLRVRLPLLLDFLERYQPDIVSLQETKVEDSLFPQEVIQQAGYHIRFKGQKTYNGVALLSRQPSQFIRDSFPDDQDVQCRILSVCIGRLKIITIYAPNGGAVGSEKYHYKLIWYQKLYEYLQTTLIQYPYVLVLGDYNVAPCDLDVYDPALCSEQILTSALERQAFNKLLELGLCDSVRLHYNQGGCYTWWDYRQGAFRRDRGFRIDHILCSPLVSKAYIGFEIDKTTRGEKRPSDHAPLLAYFHTL